jgi:hypothetical protein
MTSSLSQRKNENPSVAADEHSKESHGLGPVAEERRGLEDRKSVEVLVRRRP